MCRLLRVVKQRSEVKFAVGSDTNVYKMRHFSTMRIESIGDNLLASWGGKLCFNLYFFSDPAIWLNFFGFFSFYLKWQTTYSYALLFTAPPSSSIHACRERQPSSTWLSTTSRPHTSTSPSTSTSAPEDGRPRLIWWGRWEAAVHTGAPLPL